MIDIESILMSGIQKGASDIHMMEGIRPIFRINRILTEMKEVPVLAEKDVEDIFEFFINDNDALRNVYKNERKLDLNFEIFGARLRVNISMAKGLPIFTARIIKRELSAPMEAEILITTILM